MLSQYVNQLVVMFIYKINSAQNYYPLKSHFGKIEQK